jgi:hypothetical protein
MKNPQFFEKKQLVMRRIAAICRITIRTATPEPLVIQVTETYAPRRPHRSASQSRLATGEGAGVTNTVDLLESGTADTIGKRRMAEWNHKLKRTTP